MLFNSIDFAAFLPIVFILYWFVFRKNLKVQNAFLVVVSNIFYGWWDWRFLFLMIFSTLVDFYAGVLLGKTDEKKRRRIIMTISIFINLGMLGFFKYCNFFIDSFTAAFTFFGYEIKAERLNIILPVGISFYTFQTMSYTLDVFFKKINPTKSLVNFFAFVSFFPQLVAGPIERASNLLPQFEVERKFDYMKAVDGSRQILWGLFKKIVIADNCAMYVSDIFFRSEDLSGSTLLLGAILFTVQIYCDFSGYSDIAIGTARLFGFNLMQNFAFPFFSRTMPELWRRWHISLTSWFQDYVYFPLGGSRGSKWFKVRNTFIVFVLSGLWHGANLTFIFWGFLFAIYLLPTLLSNKKVIMTKDAAEGRIFPGIKEGLQITTTFLKVVLVTIFFRVKDIQSGFEYIGSIFNASLFKMPEVFPMRTLTLILLMVAAEWLQRSKQHALELSYNLNPLIRYGLYYGIVMIIIYLGGSQQEFIYFQF